MPRFLIEVPHEPEKVACIRAVKVLLETGSHFLTRADFGCKDGEHYGWIIVDMPSREEARMILPRAYRSQARIVQLNYFTIEELDELLEHHAE
jgi:hypothetical protein